MKSIHCKRARGCGYGAPGFPDCLPTSAECREANASFGVGQTGTRVASPALSCVSWDKALNLAESRGSSGISGKQGFFLCRFVQIKSLADSWTRSRPGSMATFFSLLLSLSRPFLSSKAVHASEDNGLTFRNFRISKSGAAGERQGIGGR